MPYRENTLSFASDAWDRPISPRKSLMMASLGFDDQRTLVLLWPCDARPRHSKEGWTPRRWRQMRLILGAHVWQSPLWLDFPMWLWPVRRKERPSCSEQPLGSPSSVWTKALNRRTARYLKPVNYHVLLHTKKIPEVSCSVLFLPSPRLDYCAPVYLPGWCKAHLSIGGGVGLHWRDETAKAPLRSSLLHMPLSHYSGWAALASGQSSNTMGLRNEVRRHRASLGVDCILWETSENRCHIPLRLWTILYHESACKGGYSSRILLRLSIVKWPFSHCLESCEPQILAEDPTNCAVQALRYARYLL